MSVGSSGLSVYFKPTTSSPESKIVQVFAVPASWQAPLQRSNAFSVSGAGLRVTEANAGKSLRAVFVRTRAGERLRAVGSGNRWVDLGALSQEDGEARGRERRDDGAVRIHRHRACSRAGALERAPADERSSTCRRDRDGLSSRRCVVAGAIPFSSEVRAALVAAGAERPGSPGLRRRSRRRRCR